MIMKRLEGLMMLGVMALAATQSFGQQISGPWTGQLDLGAQKLTIVLHFDKDAVERTSAPWTAPTRVPKEFLPR